MLELTIHQKRDLIYAIEVTIDAESEALKDLTELDERYERYDTEQRIARLRQLKEMLK